MFLYLFFRSKFRKRRIQMIDDILAQGSDQYEFFDHSTGRTSLTVEVELWAEDLLSGKTGAVYERQFVLVAEDEHGRPAPIVSADLT
jgi:hypothetical protein